MKAESARVLEAAPYERTEARKGYANGFRNKTVQALLGSWICRFLRQGALAFIPNAWRKESGRKEPIAHESCSFELSSTQVSRVAALLDEELEKFRAGPLKALFISTCTLIIRK